MPPTTSLAGKLLGNKQRAKSLRAKKQKKRKAKSEKRKAKSEKRKAKSEKRKAKSETARQPDNQSSVAYLSETPPTSSNNGRTKRKQKAKKLKCKTT
jgi:hypothetical protein